MPIIVREEYEKAITYHDKAIDSRLYFTPRFYEKNIKSIEISAIYRKIQDGLKRFYSSLILARKAHALFELGRLNDSLNFCNDALDLITPYENKDHITYDLKRKILRIIRDKNK